MTVRELRAALATMEATSDVQVVLFKNDGTSEVFELEEVLSHEGRAQLEIYEPEDQTQRRLPMADQPSSFQFEDVPLDEARRMGRGPRMEPMLYDTLRHKIQSLSSEATRIRLGPEITPQRMKNYILRMAHDLDVPVTVRRVPGGVIFWRSSEEDLQQAQETASRLQSARQPPQVTRPGRRPRGTR